MTCKCCKVCILIAFSVSIIFFQNHIQGFEEPVQLIINEVMYNPETSDLYNEWIELYNPSNQWINVSGWSITDNAAEDFLEGYHLLGNESPHIPPKGYALITDKVTGVYENYSVANKTIRLCVDDNSIGNGLSNTQDKLILKNKTGIVIDAVEWGEDFPDVLGMPIPSGEEGHSIARYLGKDTDNTSCDFYEAAFPTPGRRNRFVKNPMIAFDLFSTFFPKIPNNMDYGFPYTGKLSMNYFNRNTSYDMKVYVVGNSSSRYPATQTWNGSAWKWSYYFTHNVTTDDQGYWSDWVYLRFKRGYQEYQTNIESSAIAFIKIRIKQNDHSYEQTQTVHLLDLDHTTSHATAGGYLVGIAQNKKK